MLNKFNKEHIIGILCIIIGIIVFALTKSFPKGEDSLQLTGPAFFPNVLAIILVLMGIIEIIIGFRSTRFKPLSIVEIIERLKEPMSGTILIIIGMLIFYIVFLKVLGFFTTSFIFLFIIMWRLKIKFLKNIIYSLIMLVIVFVIFGKIFTISLPSGLLI